MNEDTVLAAEQATLGALLLNRPGIPLIARWLRPTDFNDPWHGQVWSALAERAAAGQPVDVEAMSQAMVERLGERLGQRLRVFDLLHTVPMHCRPATYAPMVLEASLRREIAGQGVVLRAGALQSTLSDSAGPVASACLMVSAALDSVASRWADAHHRDRPLAVTPTPLHPAGHTREFRTGADKFLGDRPARDPQADQEQVVALIGTLIAHPAVILEVAHWLTPGQVGDPGWRAVFTAAINLAAQGEDVDAVTVAWATQAIAQYGVQVPGVREIREVVDAGWLDHPGRLARVVAGQQICTMAERGASHLIDSSEDPALDISDLLERAGLVLNGLRRAATGLSPGSGWLANITDPPEATRGPVAG
ncbi:MAG TPA: DnaB-like helicase N-terminal domain-containing protein [Propionicimonas sp.]